MNLLKRSLLKSYCCDGATRLMSFQGLKINIDYDDPKIKCAKEKANKASQVLNALSANARAGGGAKSIHRHTVINKKLLVRDRLKLLFDPGSPFLEIGVLAGICMEYGTIPTASTVVGIGKIHNKFCIVGANDATVKGGTFFPITVSKQIRMQELALLNKLPCIYIVDSGGAFLPLQAAIFPDRDHGGRAFYNEAILSSQCIPQIAVVCGSSTAGGAYCPTMAEEAIIVKNSGVLFLGGPPLVKAATGEIVSEQDLGGADVHCRISGCTDYYAETEEDAFIMCRESISTINGPTFSSPAEYENPVFPQTDLLIISGKEYLDKNDMYIILSRILDGSKFKEFKTKFGMNLITGFGFIHGILVGLLSNCGFLTYQDAQKGTHFIQICEKRNIPLIFLQNSGDPRETEKARQSSHDFLKCRARLIAAHSCSKVPKITVCVSGCYEDDSFTMCGRYFEPNFFFAWPLAYISSKTVTFEGRPSEANILKQINLPDNFDDYEELFDNKSSAFYHASRMQCDKVISPEKTREVLSLSLEVVSRLK